MPTIIEAVHAKLDRIPEKIKAIQECADIYAARNPPQVVMHAQGEATLDLSGSAPIEIPILAGEVIYQMRSSLDHLAFALVKLNPNGTTLPVDWEENCEFPLYTALKIGQSAPLPYGCFKNLPGVSKEAHTFIERLQPYYPTGEVNNLLRFLKELCNRDKHRQLAITRSRAQVHQTNVWSNRIITTGYSSADHGAKLDLFDRTFGSESTVQVDFKLARFITFDEPTLGDMACSMRIDDLLQRMLDAIRVKIVPTFDKLINNP